MAQFLRLLERADDPEWLERLLVALAVHPEGAGFRRATLLRWVQGLDLLELAARAERPESSPTLAAFLEEAGPGHGASAASVGRGPGLGFAPVDLGGAAGEAWRGGGAAIASGGSPLGGGRAGDPVGAVTLRRDGQPRALLIVEGGEGGVQEADRAALLALGTLGHEAIAALGRRLDAGRRTRQLEALGELIRATVSTLHLAEVMRLAVRLALRGGAGRASSAWLLLPDGTLRLEALEGEPGWRERMARGAEPLALEVIADQRVKVAAPAMTEPGLPPEIAVEMESAVVAPLVAYGRVWGAIALFSPGPARERTWRAAGDDAGFVGALADLAALAVDQARRFEEAQRSGQRARELADSLRREERQSAAGELALRAAREARNPLASIGAFARRLQRETAADDPRREYLEIVLRETERLERLLAEQADYAAPRAPALEMQDLNGLVQEALQRAGETLVRRRVRLLKRLHPDLPPLLLDAHRMRRVVDNVLESALEVLPVGGRVRVETRATAHHVVLEMAHDGPRQPGEALEQLFEPFAAARAGGPVVGLSVARQVVREHGGEVRVRSEGEWSTVVAISLPVQGNEDRRRSREDRRVRRGDRRARWPRDF